MNGSGVRRASWLGLAVLLILGFRRAGTEYYGDFRVPHGISAFHVPLEELAHLMLFIALGTAVWASLALALRGSALVEAAAGWARPLADRRRAVALALSAGLFGASYLVGSQVLGHAVISDDEHVYRFIGQTLSQGRLTAPSPGRDLAFFEEQYVVLTERARYGKYPIGHPLLLAVGQGLGFEYAVVPAVTALLVWPILWIGNRVFGPTAAVLAVLLLASSPQVVLTGATYLSQSLSALCLLAGIGCLLAGGEGEVGSRRGRALLLAGGAALGYGVLVRPMPGALFIAVATADVVWRRRNLGPGKVAAALAAFLFPVALWAILLLVVNRIQTGSALTTAYQASHGFGGGVAAGMRFLGGDLAQVTMSVAGGLLRLNAWVFGWPLGLLFCLWARRGGGPALLIAMVGAEFAYRILAPKTVVAGTGPIYLFESVPLLCLLTADGLVRLARSGRALLRAPASPGSLAAVLIAGAIVNLTMFLPYKLADLHRMGSAQRLPLQMARAQGLRHALVFHRGVVPPWTGRSWAYFPRCNSPSLHDDLLFLRAQFSPETGLEPTLELWRRRFPDREAWYFGYFEGEPRLVPLESLAAPPAAPLPEPDA